MRIEGIDLKPLPGDTTPAPTVAQALPPATPNTAEAPQKPATLSHRSADVLATIEETAKSIESRRTSADAGLASGLPQ